VFRCGLPFLLRAGKNVIIANFLPGQNTGFLLAELESHPRKRRENRSKSLLSLFKFVAAMTIRRFYRLVYKYKGLNPLTRFIARIPQAFYLFRPTKYCIHHWRNACGNRAGRAVGSGL
jgi:hypothetical protein